MSENKVNGLEDAVVSEMIKKLLEEKNRHEVLPGSLLGSDGESPTSWKIVKWVFLRKPRCGAKEKESEATEPSSLHL